MKRHLIEKAVLANGSPQVGDAVVEMPVLVESWQLAALEAVACAHGVTAGALVRRLLRDFLSCSESDWPTACASTDMPDARCRLEGPVSDASQKHR